MDYERQQPPANLGLAPEQLEHAFKHNIQVRYWPLRDALCQPHVGWIRSWEDRSDGWAPAVLWVTGKAGFVSAKHCELAEAIEDSCST